MPKDPLDVLQYAYLPYPEDEGSDRSVIDDPTRGLFVWSDEDEETFELVIAHSIDQALKIAGRLDRKSEEAEDLLHAIRSCSLQPISREVPRVFNGFVGETISAALQEGMEFMERAKKLRIDASMNHATLGAFDQSEPSYMIIHGFVEEEIGYAMHVVFSMADLDRAIKTTKWIQPFNEAERTALLLQAVEDLPDTHSESSYFLGGRQALGIGLGIPLLEAEGERERALDEVRAQGLIPITHPGGRFQA